jgi:hypothetical protein
MKLVKSKLLSQIEYLSGSKSTAFFKEYLQSILEDDTKAYYQKADYVGVSLGELSSKIEVLSQEIKELQEFKKSLQNSLEIAKELNAEIFIANGIDRIDGNIISSITVTKLSTKTSRSIDVLDSNAVMELGYIKYTPDQKAIQSAIDSDEDTTELQKYLNITSKKDEIKPKVKINQKHSKQQEYLEVA